MAKKNYEKEMKQLMEKMNDEKIENKDMKHEKFINELTKDLDTTFRNQKKNRNKKQKKSD